MARSEQIREQAIAWAVRVGDSTFADWDAFTRWLEADRAHSTAYDAVAAAVAEAGDALPSALHAENDDQPAVRRPRRWLGGAIAATLAVAVAVGVWQTRGGTYAVETAPGEMRTLALADGVQLAIAGDTRIVLDRGNARVASLEHGQVLFTVRHDSRRPFTLTVGEDTLVDVGTVFEVRHDARRMSVAVAEGAVAFNPDRQNVHVAPGQKLSSESGSDAYRIASVTAAQIGEWREGRLTFDDAALAEVADDLSRATGAAFVVAPRATQTRVSGSVLVAPIRSDPRTLGPLLGVSVRYTGEAWEIGTR
jgi:transmembrane sensor